MTAPLVVLADHFLFHQLFDAIDCIAPNVANGDLAVLDLRAGELDERLAAVFSELWDRKSDHLAVVVGS